MCLPFKQLKTVSNGVLFPYMKEPEMIQTEREAFQLGSSDKEHLELISAIYGKSTSCLLETNRFSG